MLAVGCHQNGPILIGNDLILLVDGFNVETNDAATWFFAQALFNGGQYTGDGILEADGVGKLHLAVQKSGVAAIKDTGLAHQTGADIYEIYCLCKAGPRYLRQGRC